MPFTRRGLIVLFFVPCAMFCGFVAGAAIGAVFMVPKTIGIAGPFMVIGYGIIGAVFALGISLLIVFRMHGALFTGIAMAVIGAGVSLGAVTAWYLVKTGGAPGMILTADRASLPAFDLRLEFVAAIDKLPFASFEYNGASDAFRVRRINGESCAGELPPESAEKLTLLVALRHVEELFTREPAPCPPAEGDVVANLSFNIVEHTPPDTAGELALTASCITRHGALQDIVESIEQVAANLAEACR